MISKIIFRSFSSRYILQYVDCVSRFNQKIAVTTTKKAANFQSLKSEIQALSSHLTSLLPPKSKVGIILPPHSFIAPFISVLNSRDLVAVPLHSDHPVEEIAYFLSDSEASCLLCDSSTAEKASQLTNDKIHLVINIDEVEYVGSDEEVFEEEWQDGEEDALIIYTSGTTSKPKGVVHSHSSLQAMIKFEIYCLKTPSIY